MQWHYNGLIIEHGTNCPPGKMPESENVVQSSKLLQEMKANVRSIIKKYMEMNEFDTESGVSVLDVQ